MGKLEKRRVFGGDHDTPDNTGVRDYILVVDLVRGHLAAFDALVRHDASLVVNLDTGQGYSVIDVVRAFKKASGRPVSCDIAGRRAGDVASYHADLPAAVKLLGWQAESGIDRMCADHWRWQEQNPRGFAGR